MTDSSKEELCVHGKFFTLGNTCFRKGRYQQAITFYGRGLVSSPELIDEFVFNMAHAKKRLFKDTLKKESKVGVVGWEMSHNAAGRVYTLAQLYEKFTKVEMIGCVDIERDSNIWEPISSSHFPIHVISIDDWGGFLHKAIVLVTERPYDVIHLSKPRGPNIIFGILYKLIWNSKVIVDIDDEELGFFDKYDLSLSEYKVLSSVFPPLSSLIGLAWTKIAVNLAKEFDAITVSNIALQNKYGGTIVHHARDELHYRPSAKLKKNSRSDFGISLDDKVVLFMGTPRGHKGLLEVAKSIAKLGRSDVIFMIVGDFPDESLKKELESVFGVNYLFFGNKPFSETPRVVAVADVVVLLQEKNNLAAQFQMPAKLSDALAMRVPVLVSKDVPSFADLIKFGAVYPVGEHRLDEVLNNVFDDPRFSKELASKGHRYFLDNLSLSKCGSVLENTVRQSIEEPLSPQLISLANGIGCERLVRGLIF